MDPRSQRRERRATVQRIAAERRERGRDRPSLQRWRRLRRRVGAWLLRALAPTLLRVLAWTWRVRRQGPGFELFCSDRAFVVAMWHGRMLALMPLWPHQARGLGVLVSPSDDGGLATMALARFGYRVVRGSLSRGGARALREMHDWLRANGRLVLTPDGPRGPRHSMNAGAAWLARATGAEVVPLGVAVDRAWRLRSWDRFVIPKPFARLAVVYAQPVTVPADADDAAIERIASELRTTLLQAERSGFATLGVPDDLDEPGPAAG